MPWKVLALSSTPSSGRSPFCREEVRFRVWPAHQEALDGLAILSGTVVAEAFSLTAAGCFVGILMVAEDSFRMLLVARFRL